MKPEFLKNNEARICGTTVEGFGGYQTRSFSWEIKCPICGEWTRHYGEVDERTEDGEWRCICNACGKQAWQERVEA